MSHTKSQKNLKDLPSVKLSPEALDKFKKLEQELVAARKQAQEYLAGWQRAKADYQNLQKRTIEQRQALVKAATEDLVLAMLPVLDNLDRALGTVRAAGQAVGGKTVQVSETSLRQGFELIARQLREVLAAQGVSEIHAKGSKFDPSLHEAVTTVAGDKDLCVEEHAPGYKLHERVLRPSRVTVGTGAKVGTDARAGADADKK